MTGIERHEMEQTPGFQFECLCGRVDHARLCEIWNRRRLQEKQVGFVGETGIDRYFREQQLERK